MRIFCYKGQINPLNLALATQVPSHCIYHKDQNNILVVYQLERKERERERDDKNIIKRRGEESKRVTL